jgi:L-threonylcarbamoyladenylate synthase
VNVPEIAAVLRGGGIVLLPTDTIYGLHALANDDAAIARLAAIKSRDDGKPFVVLGASIEQLEDFGIAIAPDLRAQLASLWPAPLTAVLPLSHPVAASRGTASLAVRVPNVEWLRDLLATTGPLASTSANISGEAPISSPDNLSDELKNKIDAIVDRGVYGGEPSTIVDFTGDAPRIVRGDSAFTQFVWKTLRKNL